MIFSPESAPVLFRHDAHTASPTGHGQSTTRVKRPLGDSASSKTPLFPAHIRYRFRYDAAPRSRTMAPTRVAHVGCQRISSARQHFTPSRFTFARALGAIFRYAFRTPSFIIFILTICRFIFARDTPFLVHYDAEDMEWLKKYRRFSIIHDMDYSVLAASASPCYEGATIFGSMMPIAISRRRYCRDRGERCHGAFMLARCLQMREDSTSAFAIRKMIF